MGCQEKIYQKNESPTLNYMMKLCPDEKIIKYTKFFGVGTFQIFLTLVIILFNKLYYTFETFK